MEILEIRKRLEELPEEIEKAEFDFKASKAELEYSKDLKSPILANIKNTFTGTNAFQETNALASGAYRVHIELIQDSRKKSGELAAKFHKLTNELDAMRSLNKNID